MFIKLTRLKVDKDEQSYEAAEEVQVQTEAIAFLHEYRPECKIVNFMNMEKIFALEKAGKIKEGSFPTEITFTSGMTMVVAEMVSYIVEQANKPMFNTWPD